jgi:thiamine-phosphate pyrophosphorylase
MNTFEKYDLSGVYLVVDPSVERSVLLDKVEQALEGGVGILQIWNHWPEDISDKEKEQLIDSILELASDHGAPVLINDEWELLKTTQLDGVHFDQIPANFERIKAEINREFIAGITCSNDLKIVKWADEHGLDYISFCAMYPSPSVGSCEIVRPETVQKARELTDLPLFLSGGITPEKIGELAELDFNGVAVISGILNADAPQRRALDYEHALGKLHS